MTPFQAVFNNNQVFIRKNPPDEGGVLAVFVKLEDGSVEPRAQSPVPVEPGAWTHFAATWDESELLLYVDELSIYDRALAPDEIESIQEAGSSGKCR